MTTAPQDWEFTEHQRPPKPTCGVWMPYAREACARRPGHGYEHRTRYAMDNALRAGRRADLPFTETRP